MAVVTQACPVDAVEVDLNQPYHAVIVFLDLGHPVIMASVARDEPVKQGQGSRFRKFFHIPFADVAGMVVALEAVNAAAIVRVADVTGRVDTVGKEKVFPVVDVFLGGIPLMATLALGRLCVRVDDRET